MASDDDGGRKLKSGATSCEWSPDAVFCLLEKYGEKYAVGRGLLRNNDWEEVVQWVNRGNRPPKTIKQCRDKIDSLKKRYKIEKTKNMNTGMASTWPFYKKMDEILSSVVKTTFRTPPHQAKMMMMAQMDMRGGRNCSDDEADEVHPNSSSDRGGGDSPSTRSSPTPDSESEQGGTSQRKRKIGASRKESSDDESDVPDRNGSPDDVYLNCQRKIKQLSDTVMKMLSRRSRQVNSNPVQALADAIVGFSDVYARIELAKMEIYADMQLEIAKMQSKRKYRKRKMVPCNFSDSEMH